MTIGNLIFYEYQRIWPPLHRDWSDCHLVSVFFNLIASTVTKAKMHKPQWNSNSTQPVASGILVEGQVLELEDMIQRLVGLLPRRIAGSSHTLPGIASQQEEHIYSMLSTVHLEDKI